MAGQSQGPQITAQTSLQLANSQQKTLALAQLSFYWLPLRNNIAHAQYPEL